MLIAAASPLTAQAQGRAQDKSPSDAGAVVTRVVAGIVSYTRWPGGVGSIRLCAVGRSHGVEALLRTSDELGSAERSVSVVALPRLDEAAVHSCDVVYVGHADASPVRQTLSLLAGRPVLVLGEGAAFCTDGGMFCLEPAADRPRFGVNLDAVARSGLRVNPQVLRIARGTDGAGS